MFVWLHCVDVESPSEYFIYLHIYFYISVLMIPQQKQRNRSMVWQLAHCND